LKSSRYLGYALYGTPTGTPVLFCHGFPGSRLEGALWHSAAAQHNVRLIVPDRPGAGFSSFQPRRRILDWPSDLLELLSHLHVNKFHILGTTGGSAYVLACMHTLPERITSAAIVSGLYPLSLGAEDMLLMPRVMIFLATWMTTLLSILLDLMLGRAARNKDPSVFAAAFMKDVDMRPEIDKVALSHDTVSRDQFIASVQEGLRPSSYAFAWEARLLGSDWGFDLEGLETKNLVLWHGKMDTGNPISMARRAKDKLKDAELLELDEGHLSL
ncbi:Alpha/Beta hydrolase protein, partial [Massariosphaeria phaeospora]